MRVMVGGGGGGHQDHGTNNNNKSQGAEGDQDPISGGRITKTIPGQQQSVVAVDIPLIKQQ